MAKFKTRARAVDMLGRQQIAGIPTAISELFKNAHDAYAHHAEVDYFRLQNLFILSDDGIGMTEDEFLNRWLAIGTESKLAAGVGLAPPPKPNREATRPMLGEKGVGRLAIAAIGPQVLILTRAIRPEREHDTIAAFINWGIFESPGLDLDQIDIPVIPYSGGELPTSKDVLALVELFRENLDRLKDSIRPDLAKRILGELDLFEVNPVELNDHLKSVSEVNLTKGSKGTQFFILPANESLTADIEGEPDWEDEGPAPPLMQTLIGFANTMASKQAPRIVIGFRDHATREAFADLVSPANFFTPEELEGADHHFEGKFDETGQFAGQVTIYGEKPIKHTIPWMEGKGVITECGPFKLNLAYVQGERKDSRLEEKDYVLITRKLKQIGGLYIYKDGIRVLPYGNSDYDFLKLEQRRSLKASTYYFSYRRMFGYIEISARTNPELNEKAGREGFREGKAYRQFRSILRNFFLQLARDFFRETGSQSEAFIEGREELRREDEIRRAHEEQAREKRRIFSREVDEVLSRVQAGKPDEEAAQLVESTSEQIHQVSEVNPMQSSTDLLKVEVDARLRLQELRKTYRIQKPRGLALSPRLRDRWVLANAEAKRLESEVFEPIEKKVEALITQVSNSRPTKLSPQKRVEHALNLKVAEVRDVIAAESEETKNHIENIRRQAIERVERSGFEIDQVIAQVRAHLKQTQKLREQEAAILGEYYEQESLIEAITEKERTALENIRIRLQSVLESSITPDELIEAIDEENLALRERSEADVELAQLGMAVAVISHEFESAVRSVRSNLLRLKGWADVNKELRDLYKNIRSDFDHLDAYLELFTPLEKRLFRKKVVIRGSEIARYLQELFAERIKKEKVEVQVSNSFSRMAITGYPSTFYPVFINLIDNSLYWLRDLTGARIIKLDLEGGSTFVVSDSGPGVPLRDRDAIFERGFSRKPGGRGMGLKISRDVLKREGWQLILADPGLGKGATFKISPTSTKKGINKS